MNLIFTEPVIARVHGPDGKSALLEIRARLHPLLDRSGPFGFHSHKVLTKY